MAIHELREAEDALFERWVEQAENPKWDEFDLATIHVHDWRTYVPASVRAVWDGLPLLSRCAVIECCDQAASAEEWD